MQKKKLIIDHTAIKICKVMRLCINFDGYKTHSHALCIALAFSVIGKSRMNSFSRFKLLMKNTPMVATLSYILLIVQNFYKLSCLHHHNSKLIQPVIIRFKYYSSIEDILISLARKVQLLSTTNVCGWFIAVFRIV